MEGMGGGWVSVAVMVACRAPITKPRGHVGSIAAFAPNSSSNPKPKP